MANFYNQVTNFYIGALTREALLKIRKMSLTLTFHFYKTKIT